ncbi:hypothetical protein TeGR_g4604, partial [Tetraparma gracilis]
DSASADLPPSFDISDTSSRAPPSGPYVLLPFYARHDPNGELLDLLKHLRRNRLLAVASGFLLSPLRSRDLPLVPAPDPSDPPDGFRLFPPAAVVRVSGLGDLPLDLLRRHPAFSRARSLSRAPGGGADALFGSAADARRCLEKCRWGDAHVVRVEAGGEVRDLQVSLLG